MQARLCPDDEDVTTGNSTELHQGARDLSFLIEGGIQGALDLRIRHAHDVVGHRFRV